MQSKNGQHIATEAEQSNSTFNFFRAFNGLANFLDNLVGWLTSLFFKLTWIGTTALGVLVVLRFGGRKAALGTLAAFAAFAAMGLWEPSMRTFALTFAWASPG